MIKNFLLILLLTSLSNLAFAEISSLSLESEDSGKSADELVSEAEILMDQNPIDARAKLQHAIALDPQNYKAHLLLSEYYLTEVAHFDLAFKYISKAEELFTAKHGSDLTNNLDTNYLSEFMPILIYKAETELNLDKYSDALKTADRYGQIGISPWYTNTKGWILMKLGRLDEAIQLVQSSIVAGVGEERSYNMLGILLSIKGNLELSLKAFGQAIKYESKMGLLGQVATPLNNAGEVYKEMFRDSLAEASWLRATRMPDGCEHILVSLNLSMLYVEQLQLNRAEQTLKDFKSCFSERPLKSDSEHRGLYSLQMGRILFLKGEFEEAKKELKNAADRQQWFGKIGTKQEDLDLAIYDSLAKFDEYELRALKDKKSFTTLGWAKANIDNFNIYLGKFFERSSARKITILKQKNFDDLKIRTSDSLLEYPTLGRLVATYPTQSIVYNLEQRLKEDSRAESKNYYQTYLANIALNNGDYDQAIKTANKILPIMAKSGRLLKAELLSVLILAREGKRWFKATGSELNEDLQYKSQLYEILPSYFIIRGISLPLKTSVDISPLNHMFKRGLLQKADAELTLDKVGKNFELRYKGKLLEDFNLPEVSEEEQYSILLNKIFRHRQDPAPEPMADLEFQF